MLILTYILLIILMCFIGALSYYVAIGVHRMLDYGGIFWKLRFNKFLKSADGFQIKMLHEILNQDLTDKNLDNLKLNHGYPYAEKRDTLNNIYWQIVTDKPELKIWLCNECLAYRIALFYAFCSLVLFIWYGLISWYGGFIFWFFALPLITSAISIQSRLND